MNNKTYDYLKWIVITVMPALAVLIAAVGNSLNWTHTEIAVTLLNAVTAFLGAILGLSSVNYRNGNGDDE
ncbi:phage holin [Enterococcus sp. BWM-S5]|uniref:Phage holin n=1 Tax=Enterococcus larvae TaxID=2794352 RepID=A0ABS4CID7_9ENTE|nr:phage holin [Enterococcus larvae]MBP1046395.1 phage holin [Enterococcus larvae]